MEASVRPVAVSQSLIEGIDSNDLIAYCARVSNPANQMNTESSDKLVRYLAKHSHFSPFEMVSVTLEITTTRDIARQILRHRSFSFQEFSQRYADPTQDLGFTLREARLQDKKNRQNSIEVNDAALEQEWRLIQAQLVHDAGEAYDWAISKGIAKEQARAVLPEGLTVSKLYMAGTVRSWIHYCQLRSDNMIDPRTGELITGTQKEHKEVAIKCWHEIVKLYPSLETFITL